MPDGYGEWTVDDVVESTDCRECGRRLVPHHWAGPGRQVRLMLGPGAKLGPDAWTDPPEATEAEGEALYVDGDSWDPPQLRPICTDCAQEIAA